MKRTWVVSCFVLLAFLMVGPAQAADAPQDAFAFLSTLALDEGPALCEGAGAEGGAELQFLFDVDRPKPEACSPAECGQGAAQQQCGTSCCRQKCCIC
jgi:hypothetical protein